MKHGYIQAEKGPSDMYGIAVRVLKPHATAEDGYAKVLVDFWPGIWAFHGNELGRDGWRKDEVKQTIVLHTNAFYAIKAAKQEQSK